MPARRCAPMVCRLMENLSETCRSWTDLALSSANRNPCLIHIYPTGQGMGRRHALGSRPLTIGRSNECDIFINDNSVSRRHVCIEFRGDAYYAVDLQSMNGTFVNNVAAPERRLEDGDYLRVGNCIYRFKAINDEFGHLGGDLTLRELAACVKKEIRQDELLARYGGEEFGIVLPETNLDE